MHLLIFFFRTLSPLSSHTTTQHTVCGDKSRTSVEAQTCQRTSELCSAGSTGGSLSERRASTLSGVSGWRLVRFLPEMAPRFHPSTDNLVGTEVYRNGNTPTNSLLKNVAGSWSIVLEDFDEMFLSDVGIQRWLYFKKSSLYSNPQDYYGDMKLRAVLKSSANSLAHSLPFTNRNLNAEDPLIQLTTSNNDLMYAENGIFIQNWLTVMQKGSMVFVRNSAKANVVCVQCNAGKYKTAIGSAACTRCPEFFHSPAGSMSRAACLCEVGYADGPNGACVICSSGTYSSQSGQSECTLCEAGKFANQNGQTKCADCAAFATSPASSTKLLDCFCPAGTRGSNGGSCTQCQPGQYKTSPGSSPCSNCVAG